jgi:hypothetical protein
MTSIAQPGGSRKGNGRGYVRKIVKKTGGIKYEARLSALYLGSYETRAEAEARIERERAKLAMLEGK